MLKYFKFSAAIVLLMTLRVQGTRQQLTFYNGSRCIGPSTTITYSITGLNYTWIANATSVKIIGAWQIWAYAIKHFANAIMPNVGSLEYNALPPDGYCKEKAEFNGGEFYVFGSAEKFGPDDLTTSKLILYTEADFSGKKYEISGDTDQLSVQSVRIRSAMLFSNTSWVLYEGRSFTGNEIRLSSAGNNDGYKLESSISVLAGSIKRDNGVNSGKSVLFLTNWQIQSSFIATVLILHLNKY